MTAFLLTCFALPIALVFALCWKHLFGRDAEKDVPSLLLTAAIAILLSVYPVAVGWLACIIYRTGAEAWPFALVTWTGILAGGLVARGADAKRVFTALAVMREHDAAVSKKVRALGLGPQGRHDYEPFDFGGGGFRPELHALWWLRAHDSHLPEVTHIQDDAGNRLEVDGKPVIRFVMGEPEVTKQRDPLPVLAALLWIYDDTAREHQKAERIEREARKRKRKADEGDE